MRILIVNLPHPEGYRSDYANTAEGSLAPSNPQRPPRFAMRTWYYKMGRRVWFHDALGFFFRDKRLKNGPPVRAFWGETLSHEEEALAIPVRTMAN